MLSSLYLFKFISAGSFKPIDDPWFPRSMAGRGGRPGETVGGKQYNSDLYTVFKAGGSSQESKIPPRLYRAVKFISLKVFNIYCDVYVWLVG